MKEHDETDAGANTSKRFDVELFIVHPTMDPEEISTALGLDAEFAHRVGDPRKKARGCQGRIKIRDGDIAAGKKLQTNGLPVRLRS